MLYINPTTFATGSYDQTLVIWDSLLCVSSHVFKFDESIRHTEKLDNKVYIITGNIFLKIYRNYKFF